MLSRRGKPRLYETHAHVLISCVHLCRLRRKIPPYQNAEFDLAMDWTRENLDMVFEGWWAEVSRRCQDYDIHYWGMVQLMTQTNWAGAT